MAMPFKSPFALIGVALLTVAGAAQDASKLDSRYGFQSNQAFYSQKTPEDAVLSVVKAVENKRVDYLLAQLAEPQFVDDTMEEYKRAIPKGGDKAKTILAFERFVKETTEYFLEDPSLVRELRRFAKEGQWKAEGEKAVGTLKNLQNRKVFLRKVEERWFLENRQQ
ncbi:MAG: hypothetical protein L0Y72_24100 [Gemmataceae bacterium]|nr:hypothetical protein [Gemmataceae bacterium]MCI0742129.1 hypothetical protein [Gemmataceae bacterium]